MSNNINAGESVLLEAQARPVVLTERVKKLKTAFFNSKTHIVSDRSHLATLSWQETEGEHRCIRRAKLFDKICREIPIAIHPDELIVGSQTRFLRGCGPTLDWAPTTGEEISAGSLLTSTEEVEAVISEEDLRLIAEDTAYWQGKTPFDAVSKELYKEFGESLYDAGYLSRSLILTRSCDYEKVLKIGLSGIIQEAQQALSKLDAQDEKSLDRRRFLEATIITLKGMIVLARRYAKLAKEMAQSEPDPVRKGELQTIAAICSRVPEYPAEGYYEAIQSFRLIHLGLNLETDSSHEVVGRIDQFLNRHLLHDVQDGKITVAFAGELLACLFVKIHEMGTIKPGAHRKASESNYGAQITIGGIDKDGNDAVNAVSYLVLEVISQLRLAQPSVFARINKITPDEFLERALLANKDIGGGIPAFMNDERIIPNLIQDGITLEDARDYACFGCVQTYISTGSGQYDVSCHLNSCKIFELVLYNGFDPKGKKQLGPKTGDPRNFKNANDWIEAFKKQWQHAFDLRRRVTCKAWDERGKVYALPFNSALLNDCIENGTDALSGGMRYRQLCMVVSNKIYANVADSIAAIEKVVYENRAATIDEVLTACANNFEGSEALRQMLISAPKFGNDLDGVDNIMREISVFTSHEVFAAKNPYGYPMRDTRSGATVHVSDGAVVGALPDGRKDMEPLADGGISPMRGCDRSGPTAVLMSVAKAIDTNTNRSAVLNQKFAPSMVSNRENIQKLIDMMRTFFETYLGYQVQYNIMSKDTLLKAKANPEEYRDLVVRAGGYSAYFVELTEKMQNDIILRTEF